MSINISRNRFLRGAVFIVVYLFRKKKLFYRVIEALVIVD